MVENGANGGESHFEYPADVSLMWVKQCHSHHPHFITYEVVWGHHSQVFLGGKHGMVLPTSLENCKWRDWEDAGRRRTNFGYDEDVGMLGKSTGNPQGWSSSSLLGWEMLKPVIYTWIWLTKNDICHRTMLGIYLMNTGPVSHQRWWSRQDMTGCSYGFVWTWTAISTGISPCCPYKTFFCCPHLETPISKPTQSTDRWGLRRLQVRQSSRLDMSGL